MRSLYLDKKSIALNMIVRDSSKTIVRVLESVMPYVDEAVIVDTGSKDDTPEICRKFGANVIDGGHLLRPDGVLSSFADARNLALENTKSPIMIWLDSDDTLIGGDQLRRIVDGHFADMTIDYLYVTYNYRIAECGIPTAVQQRERIVRNGRGKWFNRIHESWRPNAQCTTRKIDPDYFRVDHTFNARDDTDATLSRNLVLLEEWYKEEPDDTWCGMYYGKTLHGLGRLREAARILTHVADNGEDDIQRFEASLYSSETLSRLGAVWAARQYAMKAVEIEPRDPRPYIQMARLYMEEQNYKKALTFACIAQGGEFCFEMNAHDPNAREHHARLLQACALHGLKKYEDAWKTISETNPDLIEDSSLDDAKDIIMHDLSVLQEVRALQDAFMIEHREDPFSVPETCKKFASSATNKTGWGKIRELHTKMPDHAIDIFCGDTLHPWTGLQLEKYHIGGSETLCVELAEGLAAKGWPVCIYNGREDGSIVEHKGVTYKPADLFNTRDQRNIVIYWRTPWALEYQMKTKAKIVWNHDIFQAAMWNAIRRECVDYNVFVSQWHADQAKGEFPEDKILVMPNGIRTYRVADVKREPHTALFSSMPYRGLDILLTLWPRIVEQIPDAKLLIAGGFENIWKMFLRDRPYYKFPHREHWDETSWYRDYVETLCAKCGDSVEYLGEVSREDLAKAYARASVWPYTSTYIETSCCAAMEAQYYGCIPVTGKFGALGETVREAIWTPDKCWTDMDETFNAILNALNHSSDGTHEPMLARNRIAIQENHTMDLFVERWHDWLTHIDTNKTLDTSPLETGHLDGVDVQWNTHFDDFEFLSTPTYRHIMNQVLKKKHRRVLDCGAGRGWSVRAALAGGADQIVALEISQPCIAYCKGTLKEADGKVDFVCCDLNHELPDGTFDMICAVEILEHLDDPGEFVKAIKRRVRKGGELFVTVPFYGGRYGALNDDPAHRRVFTMESVREMIGDGVEMTTDGNHILARWEA